LPIEPNTQGCLWSEQLELYLGLHEEKLRFFTSTNDLVLFPEEEERQRADYERLLREDLLSRLQAKGIDLDTL
jgi:hypothetical protein